MRIVALILLLLFSSNHLFADSIESVLKIKPPIKYNQNQKYDKSSGKLVEILKDGSTHKEPRKRIVQP